VAAPSEEAALAGLRRLGIDARVEPAGGFRVGGPGGPVLRPIAFGERAEIVARAAASRAPDDTLAAGVLEAARIEPGEGERLLLEVAALVLAGALDPGPPFDETRGVLASIGWSVREIDAAAGSTADATALALTGDLPGGVGASEPADGWTRFVFVEPEPTAGPEDLISLRSALAQNLLDRLDGTMPGADAEGSAGHEVGEGLRLARGRLRVARSEVPPFAARRPFGPEPPGRGSAPADLPLPGGQPTGNGPAAPFVFRARLDGIPSITRNDFGSVVPTTGRPILVDPGAVEPGILATSHPTPDPFPAPVRWEHPSEGNGGWARQTRTSTRWTAGAPNVAATAIPATIATAEAPVVLRALGSPAPTFHAAPLPERPAAREAVHLGHDLEDVADLADRLAILLDDESDLRGLDG
jgi:hypothetical protein